MPDYRSIACLSLALAVPMAHGEVPADAAEPPIRHIPAISVLPDGSELDGVILPQYDENFRLTTVLRAERLTIIGPNLIGADDANVTLLDPDDPDEKTIITMGTALLNQAENVIRADQGVAIRSSGIHATGSKLHFAFVAGRGFVSGPATSVIYNQSKPDMSTSHIAPRSMFATTALGIALAAGSVLQASPPPAVSEEELAELRRDATSIATEVKAKANETREQAAETARLASDISEAVRTFLVNDVLEEGADVPPAIPERAEDKPLEIEATPEDTRILSDGGFYFDNEAGILVYLENVRVFDPAYELDGVDELKIIFEKKPETPEGETPPEKSEPMGGFAAGVGEVERIIGTGRVRFVQRQPEDDKPPIHASGALFNYNVATGEVILSGGYPWVRQGNYYARALQPNLTLRIRKDGSFVTEGQWDTGQNLNR